MQEEADQTRRQKETEAIENRQPKDNAEEDKEAKRLAKLKEERCHFTETLALIFYWKNNYRRILIS